MVGLIVRVSIGPPISTMEWGNIGIVIGLHAGNRSHQYRHRGLAHCQHMHVAMQQMQHRDHVVDVVVEIVV